MRISHVPGRGERYEMEQVTTWEEIITAVVNGMSEATGKLVWCSRSRWYSLSRIPKRKQISAAIS